MLFFVILISFILSMVYVYMGCRVDKYWREEKDGYALFSELPFISIVVCYRDEEEHLEACIHSLLSQNYPPDQYEIIMVDDHSSDLSRSIVNRFSEINSIVLENGIGKKAAQSLGILHTSGEFIALTDADCIVSHSWLSSTINELKNRSLDLLAGRVKIRNPEMIIERFQEMDMRTIMRLTNYGIHKAHIPLGSAANLVFSRSLYERVGMGKRRDISSGDDTFFIQAVLDFASDKVGFSVSKDSVVSTFAQSNWKDLVFQRIRWASKAKHYDSRFLFFLFTLALFDLVMISVLICSVMSIVMFVLFVFLFLIKSLVLYINLRGNFFHVLGFAVLQSVFYLIVPIASIIWGRPYWKDRELKI